MAETTAKATTPRRTRATGTTTRKTATAKPAATKAAPAKAAAPKATAKEETPAESVDRFVVEFEYVSDTKSYAKFAAPASLAGTLVGSIYAPLGTDRVKVAIFGVDAEDTDDTE